MCRTFSMPLHSVDRSDFLPTAGRAALTDNFDACRDLSGRRMRHVNADKKLADWAAQAKDRELKKGAAKHLREQERAAQQEEEQQVCQLPSDAQLPCSGLAAQQEAGHACLLEHG